MARGRGEWSTGSQTGKEFGPLPTLSGHAISNSAFPQGMPCEFRDLPGEVRWHGPLIATDAGPNGLLNFL